MSATMRGTIEGNTTRQRAIRLAGCLAELGEGRLLTIDEGGTALGELHARETDLPAWIERAIATTGAARLRAPDLGADFILTRESGSWSCGDPQVGALLRQGLH